MNNHLIKPDDRHVEIMRITPASAKWNYLSFTVVKLKAGERYEIDTFGNEVALVPLKGVAMGRVDGINYNLSRKNMWEAMPNVLYAPPRKVVRVSAESAFEFAYGGAPAVGRYPVRLFKPSEQEVVIRGDGMAKRQVNFTLQHPLPAERLILFEVYVSGGMYSGWPPHCHDGFAGSPYLEETYYYRIDPQEDGYALHRNYRIDNDFDEVFTVRDGECVLVTEGFHPVAVPPGNRVYFLNYLAGELQDEDRAKPPYDDPAWADMKNNYMRNEMTYPIVKP